MYEDSDVFEEESAAFEKHIGKRGIIIAAVVFVLALALCLEVTTNGRFARNFSTNISRIFSSMKSDKDDTPKEAVKEETKTETQKKTTPASSIMAAFEGAGYAETLGYKNGIICAETNHLAFINAAGETEWEMNTTIVDPILRIEGEYILLAEKGRSKLCLYNANKLLYEAQSDEAIINASLSSSGDALIITDKASYKGGISVYNKAGEQIFSWSSGSGMIMSADISSSSRRVAAAVLNTDSTVKTTIQLFNIKETDSYSKTDIENTVIFDVSFAGNTLCAFGDNRIVGITDKGAVTYNNTFGEKQLVHSASDDKGNSLLFVDMGSVCNLQRYNKKGELKETLELSGNADFIDIGNGKILYSTGRDIYFRGFGSDTAAVHTATMDIKRLFIISENAYAVVYSNSIEIVTV